MAEPDTIRFVPSVKLRVFLPFGALTAVFIIVFEVAAYIKFGKSFWLFVSYYEGLPTLVWAFCLIWTGAVLISCDVRCSRFELNLEGICGYDAWYRRRFIPWQSIAHVKVRRNYLLWKTVLVFERDNRWPVHLRKEVLRKSTFDTFLRNHLGKTSTLYEATAS